MEAIVSIIILALLMTAITTMIMTSRRMTANSMIEARELQEETLNPVLIANYGTGVPVTITLTGALPKPLTIATGSSLDLVTSSHTIYIYDNADNPDIIAFRPAP